jgi:hypothetical protein
VPRSNVVERDVEKIDRARAKVDASSELIIRQQEQVIVASEKGIEKLNSDMDALRKRLEPYLKTVAFDERYYELKARYVSKLGERGTLERARVLAEESITAAKLHMIPGEGEK